MKVGEIVEMNVETNHPYQTAQDSGYVFKKEFHSPNSSYVRIHFANFQLADDDYIVITSPKTDQEIVYAGGGKWVAGGERTISNFWALPILADHAVVRLYSTGADNDYGFKIDKAGYGYSQSYLEENVYESVCGSNDREEIACYNGTPVFQKGKAVCKILQGGNTLCTGWLLGTEGHVMTNNHCVDNQNTANSLAFQFNYQHSTCNGSDAQSNIDQVAQTSTFVCTDQGLDYTLLKLPVNPTNDYGFLSLRSNGPNVGERIYIPQHPSGIPKKISVNDDQTGGFAEIVSIDQGGRVEYYADTEGGSSGSPVLGYNDHLVVALHNTGGCLNGSNRSDAIINDMASCLPNGAVDNPGNLVSAAFTMSKNKSCDGSVTLTNQSFNDSMRTWYFGDGNSLSSVNNPTHTYNSPGNYTITLVVEDSAGTKDTASKFLEVPIAQSPSGSNDTICGSGSLSLSANGSGGEIRWYNAPNNGSLVDSGSTLTTPTLSNTTSYYVEEVENTPVQSVGPVDNNIFSGRYFDSNDNWGCLFDVSKPMILKSVKVFSDMNAQRTIELRQNGNVLQSKTLTIPNGQSRITLDFQISPGDQYLLKVTGSTVNLYRNDGGANYPYDISGFVSITGNNTTSGNADDYYYYFYDWNVKEVPCRSDRQEVKAVVTDEPSLSFTVSDASCQGGSSGAVDLSVANVSGTVDYQWSNGANTQDLSNLQAGNYSVTVQGSSSCTAIDSVNVGSSGQAPNISPNVQDVSCEGNEDGAIDLTVSNTSGTSDYQWSTGDTTQDVNNLGPGIYSVTVDPGSACSATETTTVGQGGNRPDITPDVNDVSCNGDEDGSINLSVTDTVNPVIYQWAHGKTGNSITSLSPGIYAVTVQNGNNCTQADTITVNEPNPVNVTAQGDSSLVTTCQGQAWVQASGGTPGYSYQWDDSNQQTADTAKALCPGTYTVTVTDQNGCSKTARGTVDTTIETSIGGAASTEPNVELYPVPVEDHVVIELIGYQANKEVEVTVHNMLGQDIHKKSWPAANQSYTLTMSGIDPGAYIISIKVAEEIIRKKVSVAY